MRIHTNRLEIDEIEWAATRANDNLADSELRRPITIESLTQHRSLSRARAFDVKLSGDSARSGHAGGYKAATWDQWGEFLAMVFENDHVATVPGVYLSRAHFHWTTTGRYALRGNFEYCRQHRFRYSDYSADGTYDKFRCSKCDAMLRRLNDLSDWDQITR